MTREEWRDRAVEHGVEIAKLKKQLERLEKQLEIAIKCLKNYKSGTTDKWFVEVALEQIKELEK